MNELDNQEEIKSAMTNVSNGSSSDKSNKKSLKTILKSL